MNERQTALLRNAIDYAGLFPPAQLDMGAAVANYRRYRAGAQRWALGRFVCPVGRLGEFAALRGHGDGSWPVAAVGTGQAYEEASAIARFNQDHYGRARVEAIEAKTPDAAAVQERVQASRGVECYCEISPTAPEFRATAEAIREAGAQAKLRTGGTVPEAIPAVKVVVEFLLACRDLGLAFKATAGLHHPYAGEYPLTYAAGAPIAAMHGFVNLGLAATALAAGAETSEIEGIMAASGPSELDVNRWPVEQIEAGRRFFRGFGSCSFEEPLEWSLPPA